MVTSLSSPHAPIAASFAPASNDGDEAGPSNTNEEMHLPSIASFSLDANSHDLEPTSAEPASRSKSMSLSHLRKYPRSAGRRWSVKCCCSLECWLFFEALVAVGGDGDAVLLEGVLSSERYIMHWDER